MLKKIAGELDHGIGIVRADDNFGWTIRIFRWVRPQISAQSYAMRHIL